MNSNEQQEVIIKMLQCANVIVHNDTSYQIQYVDKEPSPLTGEIETLVYTIDEETLDEVVINANEVTFKNTEFFKLVSMETVDYI